MTDIGNARKLFSDAKLAFPTIPEELSRRIKELDRWVFSTRPLTISPYDIQSYIHEVEETQIEDYTVLSHSGHGVNSYAIQYYLVFGSLHMFLHLGWGGVYMNAERSAANIRKCFSLADQLVLASQTKGKFRAGERLLVVGSDFYGSYWLPPKETCRREDDGTTDAVEVLTQSLTWITNYR